MPIYFMRQLYFVLQSTPPHRVAPGVEKHMVGELPSGQGSRVPPPVRRRDARQSRRRLSRHGVCALGAMLVPAVLFPTGLLLLRADARFTWLRDVRAYPLELWIIAVCGTVATGGGMQIGRASGRERGGLERGCGGQS